MPVASSSPITLFTPSGQRKYLTADERARFIAAAWMLPRRRDRTLCLTLAYTGCRVSEATALTAGSIQPGDGFVTIRSLKKRRGNVLIREIPLPLDVLREIVDAHAISASTMDRRLWQICRGRAWQIVKAAMRIANIGAGVHATPKGLRHGFGLHAVRRGVPLNLVQRWLGHASLTTTAIYLQAMGAEERAIAARMWDGPGANGVGLAGPTALAPETMCRERDGCDPNGNKVTTHIIWQLVGEPDAARWIKIGFAVPDADGKALSLIFDTIPCTGRTVMREVDTGAAGNGAL